MDQESTLQKFLVRLKAELPEAVAETQKIDKHGNAYILYALKQEFVDELKGIGLDAVTDDNRYELQFPGKRQASLQTQIPSYKTLKAEPEQSVDFEETGNVFIEGDNIDILRLLQKSYRGKVKMIYIDPPYNTGGDGFDYNDDFSQAQQDYLKAIGVLDENGARQISEINSRLKGRFHAGWLAMMYPRLKLARELLKDDGSIFISIDDNEQANLKLLCDEIFGEDNFQYCLSVVNSLNGNDNSSGMMETQDYCLIYSKNHRKFQMGVLAVEDEDLQREWQQDEKGYWKKGGSLKATGINAPRSARPKLFFPIYIDEQDLSISLEKTDRHTYKLLPMTDNKEMSWYWSENKFVQDSGEVIVTKVNNGYALYKKQRPSFGDRPSKRGKTTFYSPNYSNTHSNQTIHKLFGRRVFSYPKPVALLQDLIRLADCSGEIVMDFFAGSASTGHAVMQLNAEDGGGRKFVLVQMPEQLDKKKSKEAFEFCISSLTPPPSPSRPTIADIAKERLRRAGKAVSEQYPLIKVDTGFRVFTVQGSLLCKIEEDKLTETEQKDLLGYRTELKADDFETLIYEAVLKTGVALDIPLKAGLIGNYPVALCDRRCYCVTEGLTQEIMNTIIAEYGQEFDTLYYLSDCPALGTSYVELEAAIKLAGDDKQVEVLSFY